MNVGNELYDLIERLFPICRSITGDGVRQTLSVLSEKISLDVVETPSGTEVFDWNVPDEWNIRDAYVADSAGHKVIDFARHNLHVLNYSVGVRERMPLSELRPHLYTLPDQPDLIPYRTSYYSRNWGFCLSHREFERMGDGDYDVVIDASLEPGSLTYGEFVIPGESAEEVLISTHICHPSLANDNLSGIAIATFLARRLASKKNHYTYRFVFVPGTIGSLTWLSRNEDTVGRIRYGLVLTGLGDAGKLVFKQSRHGNTAMDKIAGHVLKNWREPGRVIPWHPYGYDERQYCSPGFDLPVGRLSRTPHGEFPEYHTSADNLSFVKPAQLEDSLYCIEAMLDVVEENVICENLSPKGEPRLGKRGLYRSIAGQTERQWNELDLLWVLSGSDGSKSLLDIAEQANRPFAPIAKAAEDLQAAGLLKKNR